MRLSRATYSKYRDIPPQGKYLEQPGIKPATFWLLARFPNRSAIWLPTYRLASASVAGKDLNVSLSSTLGFNHELEVNQPYLCWNQWMAEPCSGYKEEVDNVFQYLGFSPSTVNLQDSHCVEDIMVHCYSGRI